MVCTAEYDVISEPLSDAELVRVRRLLEVEAIQAVMLRYTRCADRNDPALMKTIFWDEGTDNHGIYEGSATGFFERAYRNRDLLSARYHITGPVSVDFVDNCQARVETYFHYVGVFVHEGGETLGQCAGRYRDLFEKRQGEWRVLRRVTVYDWSTDTPYEPGWDFFQIPLGINRGTVEPHDATYAEEW